jgi:hypothetical protein
MARCVRATLVVAGLLGGVAVALAYRISRESGKDLTEAFTMIPAELRRRVDEVRGRAMEALASGRRAATEKEQEIAAFLAVGGARPSSGASPGA